MTIFKPMKNHILFLSLVLMFTACRHSEDHTHDSRPADLRRFILELDKSKEKYDENESNSIKQDEIYQEQLRIINKFIGDSLQDNVKSWPGKLMDVRDHPEYLSFSVHILKDLADTTSYPQFSSIVLSSIILKSEKDKLHDFMKLTEKDSVIISGEMTKNDKGQSFWRSYSTLNDNPFANPGIEISLTDIKLIR